MIYRLLHSLSETVSGFNVFGYITFRAALAALTALLLSVLIGPWLVRRLIEFQISQTVREEGPSTHHAKTGTPTMGGLLILISIVIATLFWGDLQNPFVLLALLSTVAFGAIGFIDDYQKVARKHNLGLSAKQKFALQLAVALVVGLVLLRLRRRHPDAIFLSARTGKGVDLLGERLAQAVAGSLQSIDLLVPHRRYDLMARLHSAGTVLREEYEDDGIHVTASVAPDLYAAVAEFLASPPSETVDSPE